MMDFGKFAINLEATTGNITVAGVVCIVSLLAVWEYRSWCRLRHVPGPFWHSLSIYPMNKLAGSGRMSFILKDYGDKYGM